MSIPLEISVNATRITMIAGGRNLVWLPSTADVPSNAITLPAGLVPSTALGIIIGVEVGYSAVPALPQTVQCNIQRTVSNGSPSYPYTDLFRTEQYFDPAAAVGAVMQQGWVPFETLPLQQIRYWLVSTDPSAVNKHLIIDLHGWWE